MPQTGPEPVIAVPEPVPEVPKLGIQYIFNHLFWYRQRSIIINTKKKRRKDGRGIKERVAIIRIGTLIAILNSLRNSAIDNSYYSDV